MRKSAQQRSFRFPRGANLPSEYQTESWLITYDARHPVCGFTVRVLEDWRPTGRDLIHTPTLEAARLQLPYGGRGLLRLEGIEAARLVRERVAVDGEILELWF